MKILVVTTAARKYPHNRRKDTKIHAADYAVFLYCFRHELLHH